MKLSMQNYSGYPRLNVDTNFQRWKKQISVLLERDGCLSALTTPRPTPLASTASEQEKTEFNVLLETWKQRELNARSTLLTVVEEPAFDIIESQGTANDMWTTLCKEYEKSNLSTNCRLRRQFYSMKLLDDGSDVDVHLRDMLSVRSKLSVAGFVMNSFLHSFIVYPNPGTCMLIN